MPKRLPNGGPLLIHGGRVLDPARGWDGVEPIRVAEGRIVEAFSENGPEPVVLDASGWWVLPGPLDLHVHLREPGGEEAETVASGLQAAVHGGITAVGAMPNTSPPMDTPEEVRALLARARAAGAARVIPCACLTVGRAGTRPADLEALANAGAWAFTDDGTTPADPAVFEAALTRAAALGRPVLDHALDPSARGHLHAGRRAAALGLEGIPSEAEFRIVERDVALARKTGGHVHIQHLSTRESVALIREARRAGWPVSGEVTPHHLALCEEDIPGLDSRYKMNPPLRSPADRDALREGVADGTITVLATDHAPHSERAKRRPFPEAPPGVIGLETALGVTHRILVETGLMTPLAWTARWTTGPAEVLGLCPPTLRPGVVGDLVIFDPQREWTVQPERFVSRSRNTPFEGWLLRGKPVLTMVEGFIRFADPVVFDRMRGRR